MLLSLCWSQSATLPSYNGLCSSRQCCLSGRFAPFQQQSAQLQIVLSIRSLCSLPTMVCDTVSNIVRQVAVLPSFTGNLHCCKSGRSVPFLQQWGHSQLALLTACSNFIPIYPNLFEFILNYSEFYRVFEWKARSCDKVAWSVLSQQPSSHIRSRVHTRYLLFSLENKIEILIK